MTSREKAYRNLTRMISRNQIEYFNRMTNNFYSTHEKYRAWLQLLGLIETWVITHDR